MTDEQKLPPDSSLRDDVTGLYNHRQLSARIQENMARCDRQNEKMFLILWDIDGFRKFNNEYGQKEGDRVLKSVATTLRRLLRVYDEAFRSESDEFCTLIVPADEKVALDVTRRVNDMVSKELFAKDGTYGDFNFSISSGMVAYPSDHKNADALLYAAREALFQTKKSKV